MNFSKYSTPFAQAKVLPSVSTDDFELFLETCQTMGDFYMGRVISSIYWNGVIGTYNSIHNCYGDHAPTYIASMEKLNLESSNLVYWLHAMGYRPAEDDNSNIVSIIDFVHEELDNDTETVLVINEHIRELKKHNHLLSAQMTKVRAQKEFKQLPEAVRTKYQDIINSNIALHNEKESMAKAEVIKKFRIQKDVTLSDLSPTKLYTIVAKANENLGKWIAKEEEKKFIAATKHDQYMVNLTSSTLELLDAVKVVAQTLLNEAEEKQAMNPDS